MGDLGSSLSTITLLKKIISFVKTNTKENIFMTLEIGVQTVIIGERESLHPKYTEPARDL